MAFLVDKAIWQSVTIKNLVFGRLTFKQDYRFFFLLRNDWCGERPCHQNLLKTKMKWRSYHHLLKVFALKLLFSIDRQDFFSTRIIYKNSLVSFTRRTNNIHPRSWQARGKIFFICENLWAGFDKKYKKLRFFFFIFFSVPNVNK